MSDTESSLALELIYRNDLYACLKGALDECDYLLNEYKIENKGSVINIKNRLQSMISEFEIGYYKEGIVS